MNGAVHRVVALADSLGKIPGAVESIEAGLLLVDNPSALVCLDWQTLMPGLIQSIQIDLSGGIIMYFILVVVVGFSILNTFLMAVLERTREFGVMMAVGTTPGRLIRLLLLESMCLTLVGLISGTAVGCLLTLVVQHTGINIGDASGLMVQFGMTGRLYPRLSVLSATAGPMLILLITFIAALLPTLRIRRLKPVEAMVHA